MRIYITRQEAEELVEAHNVCEHEGYSGVPDSIIQAIFREYPDLEKELNNCRELARLKGETR